MCRQIASMFRIAITFALLIVPAIASGVYLPSRYFTRSSLMKGQDCRPLSRSRRTRQNWAFDNSSETRLVARKKRIQQEVDEAEEASFDRDLTYNDLGPIGKTVAGCTEVVITTVMDFCTGYIQGWLLGTIVGTPGFVFRPVEKGLRQPFSKELSGRFARMNTRNKNWSKTFGRISAAFGGVSILLNQLLKQGGSFGSCSHFCLLFFSLALL